MYTAGANYVFLLESLACLPTTLNTNLPIIYPLAATSEFAGQIIRVSSGGGIFLDVVWLTTILRPILSHKLADEIFPQHSKMRDELVHNGVLRLKFAEHLWRHELPQGRGRLSDEVVDALCGVIYKLGIALPLDPRSVVPGDCSSYSGRGTSRNSGRGIAGRHDMLVIMRLSETCTPTQQKKLEELLADAQKRQGIREVVLKWRFDIAGPPVGLVERLIASCYVVGKVEQGLCWRHGAVFKSYVMAAACDGERGPVLIAVPRRMGCRPFATHFSGGKLSSP